MLSDTAIRALKAKPKPYKVTDEKGMFLLINPNGSKYFRLKYRFDGKEKVLALGVYPEVSLKEARDNRDTARKQIAGGIDPSANRKAVKASKSAVAANSFEVIAREWGEKKIDTWAKPEHPYKRMLERHIFPWLGSKSITELLPRDVLDCLRRIESNGFTNQSHRVLQLCGQVFRYAVATSRIDSDITRDLRGALTTTKTKHFAAITKPSEVGELLRALDDYKGSFPVVCALKLAPLLFVRPTELRTAEWAHIDLDAKEWRYLVTKTDVQHIVPLSTQAIDILKELKPYSGNGRYIFPSHHASNGDNCLGENTLNAALRRLGYTKEAMTMHGFRAIARTLLDEVLGFRPDFIEHQLAHALRDPNGRAYNRTAHLSERHKMMQTWADYLDSLKNGAQVIAFKKIG
jgi:integrase